MDVHTAGPDPLLTASLYCAGCVDEALGSFVAPLRSSLQSVHPADPPLLWVLRQQGAAAHIELHLHAPEAERERLRRILETAAHAFLSELRRAAAGGVAPSLPSSGARPRDAPAATASASASDASFLCTGYERSPLLFGDPPLLEDDAHVMRLVRCFSASCDLVLRSFDRPGVPAHGARQAALLEILLRGLAPLAAEPAKVRAYLAFHRDWIVRYPVLVTRKGPRKARAVFTLLGRQLAGIGLATRDGLRRRAEELWTAWPSSAPESAESRFSESLDRLGRSLLPLSNRRDLALDPFAHGPLFPIFFKVFHLAANQLGVGFLDEAFAHHLLLASLGEGRPPPAFVFLRAKLEKPRPASAVSEEGVHALSAAYPWTFYVTLASAGGGAWVQRFFAAHGDAYDQAKAALDQLRDAARGAARLARAEALLDLVDRRMQVLAKQDLVSRGVLGRFYAGTVAYYHYCRGDLARAAAALDEAQAHLVAAVDAERALLPALPLSADIPLQKARIARRQRHWSEMRRHLRQLCDVQAGRRPLCVLSDGKEVTYELLGRLYGDRSRFSREQQRAIADLIDLDQRLAWANRRVQDLFAPRELLIGYS